jgi:hypothetical protein
MGQHGFTREELRGIFNLDPQRQQDRSAIAALQASLTRQLDPMPSTARPRLRIAAMQLLKKRGRRAA